MALHGGRQEQQACKVVTTKERPGETAIARRWKGAGNRNGRGDRCLAQYTVIRSGAQMLQIVQGGAASRVAVRRPALLRRSDHEQRIALKWQAPESGLAKQ